MATRSNRMGSDVRSRCPNDLSLESIFRVADVDCFLSVHYVAIC
jgi:hypothetical protein